MNHSASRIPMANCDTPTFFSESPLAVVDELYCRARRRGAADHLLRVPVEAQPLLAMQRLSFQAKSVMCVCPDVRAAQRYFCEAMQAVGSHEQPPFLLHELMPVYQQDYILTCMRGVMDGGGSCPAVVIISAALHGRLVAAGDPLLELFKVVQAGEWSGDGSSSRGIEDPSVSCICLRTGTGGRWLLMDHDQAAVVTSRQAPSPEIVNRLIRHTVTISGRHLAPYLAMMFDVPRAWRAHPELASRALLIFDRDECLTGCNLPGIPPKIIWNDVLGIVFAG
jgi:hypothetical protein